MHTDRDQEIVAWIGRLGAAGAEHVMERFAMGRSQAYERLTALVDGALLELRTLLHRQPGLYVATAEGLRWQGLQRLGVCRVGPSGFVHAREVAGAAVALQRGFAAWRMVSEREIRVAERDAGRAIASAKLAELPTGQAALHRPDLAAISPDGHVIAVEVELSAKAPRRLEMICRAWARARHVECVYYLAAPAARGGLDRAIGEVRARERILVIPLAEIGALAPLARTEAAGVRR